MGIILALFLHGMPMGFFQMMGVIALAGVIVHDGILMIDFINREREAGKGLEDAIVSGAQKRLRPIILTAGTAAIGLFPMAYGIGGHDPMLQPLAIAFMWGLIFGTFLTLVLIPNIYMILEEVQNKASAIKKKWNVRFGGDPERKGAAE
jgi:multidrug efflux pump subunit AcrB